MTGSSETIYLLAPLPKTRATKRHNQIRLIPRYIGTRNRRCSAVQSSFTITASSCHTEIETTSLCRLFEDRLNSETCATREKLKGKAQPKRHKGEFCANIT